MYARLSAVAKAPEGTCSPDSRAKVGKQQMGTHLGGRAGITSTGGTQEVAPEAGDVS
jgi:hypothetical protein